MACVKVSASCVAGLAGTYRQAVTWHCRPRIGALARFPAPGANHGGGSSGRSARRKKCRAEPWCHWHRDHPTAAAEVGASSPSLFASLRPRLAHLPSPSLLPSCTTSTRAREPLQRFFSRAGRHSTPRCSAAAPAGTRSMCRAEVSERALQSTDDNHQHHHQQHPRQALES